jgi:glycosyltransferase involved in cell wall biosynthesis
VKFSVIIPTHDHKYLKAAVESVLAQTCQDFEIVVVPNGKQAYGAPTIAGIDKRVRIVLDYKGSSHVGSVKNFAFMHGEGEILVELDHDDLLAPDALSEIGNAFQGSGADMVYGNFAEFSDDGVTPNAYDPTWNWKSRPVSIMGRDLMEVRSFPPSPASLGKVYFAPNHPRAWKRDFYRAQGGHNPDLQICDDQELMIRTYVHGKMHHVDRCLYLYRLHPENTIRSTQKEILETTWRIYSDWIERLVLRSCSLSNLLAVNLSVTDERAGWIYSDIRDERVDFPRSTVGAFWIDGALQRVRSRDAAMRMIHGFLVPGGWLLSQTPSASGKGAFANPLANTPWNDLTFRYYTDKAYANTIGNVGSDAVRFQPQRLAEYMPSKWHADNNCPYVYFDGIALKGDTYDGPGPIDI